NQLVSSPIVVKNAPLSRKPVALKINGYTIQVASFNNKSYALKEAEFLKKKGLVPLLFSNGNYIILCVGNFPNKETAQPLLSELNKRYPNCSIRRL
ncbi:MAG: SPOR domain-containing protein, partial [Candidatus Omnitrophica bacterium]|nr:SPOR domain-containing protein [Candidatus Omnitrophota bacterium]